MSHRYSALPDLAFTDWDGEVEAVYCPSAAKTHLLSADAAVVLRALCQSPEPMHDQALADWLDGSASINPGSEQLPKVDVAWVQQLLDGLYIAGLTHRHE